MPRAVANRAVVKARSVDEVMKIRVEAQQASAWAKIAKAHRSVAANSQHAIGEDPEHADQ